MCNAVTIAYRACRTDSNAYTLFVIRIRPMDCLKLECGISEEASFKHFLLLLLSYTSIYLSTHFFHFFHIHLFIYLHIVFHLHLFIYLHKHQSFTLFSHTFIYIFYFFIIIINPLEESYPSHTPLISKKSNSPSCKKSRGLGRPTSPT